MPNTLSRGKPTSGYGGAIYLIFLSVWPFSKSKFMNPWSSIQIEVIQEQIMQWSSFLLNLRFYKIILVYLTNR